MKKLTVWVAALLAMMLFAAGGALGEEGRLPEDGAGDAAFVDPHGILSFRYDPAAFSRGGGSHPRMLEVNGSAAGSAWRRAGEVL